MVAGLLDDKLQLISNFLQFTITSFVYSWACRAAGWELARFMWILLRSLSLLAGHSPKSAKAVQRVIHS